MKKEEKRFFEIDEKDKQLFKRDYNSRMVYRNLRFTRETIRYYEKIGLLSSTHRDENNYRKYGGKDFSTLLSIDAYRQKGYSNAQIKKMLTNCTLQDLQEENQKRRVEIKQEIERLKLMEASLEREHTFINDIHEHLFQFSICDMPAFRITQRLESILDFQKYEESVLPYIDESDSILSHIVREVSFQLEEGYVDSKACIIQPCAEDDEQIAHKGKAIYCIVDSENDSDKIMEKMFLLEEEYIKHHHIKTKGVVYINFAIQCCKDGISKCYHESWVPILDEE